MAGGKKQSALRKERRRNAMLKEQNEAKLFPSNEGGDASEERQNGVDEASNEIGNEPHKGIEQQNATDVQQHNAIPTPDLAETTADNNAQSDIVTPAQMVKNLHLTERHGSLFSPGTNWGETVYSSKGGWCKRTKKKQCFACSDTKHVFQDCPVIENYVRREEIFRQNGKFYTAPPSEGGKEIRRKFGGPAWEVGHRLIDAIEAAVDAKRAAKEVQDEKAVRLREVPSTNTTLTFLGMPGELRNKIYEAMLVYPYPVMINIYWESLRPHPQIDGRILRACRTTYNEGLAIYYGCNTWEIDCSDFEEEEETTGADEGEKPDPPEERWPLSTGHQLHARSVKKVLVFCGISGRWCWDRAARLLRGFEQLEEVGFDLRNKDQLSWPDENMVESPASDNVRYLLGESGVTVAKKIIVKGEEVMEEGKIYVITSDPLEFVPKRIKMFEDEIERGARHWSPFYDWVFGPPGPDGPG